STKDGALGLVAHGDGSLAVYRLSDGSRLALGRAGANRYALVLFDPSKLERKTDDAERGRLQRLADALSCPSRERLGRTMVVQDMEVTEAAEFSPDGGLLAAWDETGDRLDLIDLGPGGRFTTFDGS